MRLDTRVLVASITFLALCSTHEANAFILLANNDVNVSGSVFGNVHANQNLNVNLGSIVGDASASNNVNGTNVTGTITSGAVGATLPTLTDLESALLGQGFAITSHVGNLDVSALTPDGIYSVQGDVKILSTFNGKATILATNNVIIENGATLSGFVAPSLTFPTGLAVFSERDVNVGGDVFGAILSRGNVNVNANQRVGPLSAVPEPSSLLAWSIAACLACVIVRFAG